MSNADERRLAWAFCVSVVIHVLVISQAKIDRERRLGTGSAFTVTLPSPRVSDGGDSPPARLAAPVAGLSAPTVLLKSGVERAAVAKPTPRQAVAPKYVGSDELTVQQQVAARPLQPGKSSVKASPRAPDRGPGVVDVLLVIGHDGHPRGIHWDRLPALTNDQLRELEALVRRQVYPSMEGARLTQTIDVFGLLAISRRAPGIVGESAP